MTVNFHIPCPKKVIIKSTKLVICVCAPPSAAAERTMRSLQLYNNFFSVNAQIFASGKISILHGPRARGMKYHSVCLNLNCHLSHFVVIFACVYSYEKTLLHDFAEFFIGTRTHIPPPGATNYRKRTVCVYKLDCCILEGRNYTTCGWSSAEQQQPHTSEIG